MSFANIVLNQALVGYGDTPVAAMGVAMKSNMLVVLLQIGLCVGIQPLIGYNYGAGNKKRLMQVFKFTGIVSVVMGTILTLLMMAARKTLVQVFINDAQVIAYGIQMVIALQLSAPFLGILFLMYQYDPGNGKSDPVAGPDCLSSGIDLYPADLYFKSYVWTGRRYLCAACSGLSVHCSSDPDLYPFVQDYGA